VHESIKHEIDVVAADFKTHKGQLLSKISNILTGAIEKSFIEAHKVDWKVKNGSDDPNAFVQTLMKSVISVHKIVNDSLQDYVSVIFTEVFDNFIGILDNFLSTHEALIFDDENGNKNFEKDMNFLSAEIKKLNLGECGNVF
jgi:hypothetical protein